MWTNVFEKSWKGIVSREDYLVSFSDLESSNFLNVFKNYFLCDFCTPYHTISWDINSEDNSNQMPVLMLFFSSGPNSR